MVDASPHTSRGLSLLETKLYRPQWRSGRVSRPRLVKRLQEGMDRKLTLISAQAGFGKTTLLTEWLAADALRLQQRVGWVSLASSDNDPTLFWAYVITALQQVRPDVGAHALTLLYAAQPPPIPVILTTLINDLSALEVDVVLVLDDYHVIETEPIHDGFSFLLDHMPASMHVVIASRSDPPFPLPRLRARRELVEIRAQDLRFTADEASAFLNQMMGLELAADDIAALEARTEGWIAGLQLAALSVQGRTDAQGFIAAFSGDDRYITDYLIEEVLQRQSGEVRRFLLQTAILERLSGPLCDAIGGHEGSQVLLEALERDNLFVVPLDDKRQWYRYHHLFADVLHARALTEQPEHVRGLHQRASVWYETNGFSAEAVRHAFAAEDYGRVATMIEIEARHMITGGQEATWRGWIRRLPDAFVKARPVLSVYYAFSLLPGDLEAAEQRLQDAERLLDTPGKPVLERVVVNAREFEVLPGVIAVARAYCAGARGEITNIVRYAQQALDLLPEDEHFWRGAVTAILGIAQWSNGELEAAERSVMADRARVEQVKDLSSIISVIYLLSQIQQEQGRLRAAMRSCEQALAYVNTYEGLLPQGAADVWVSLAELCREQNDLEAAKRHLKHSKSLGEHAALVEVRHRWYVVSARIHQAEGDFDEALRLLEKAEQVYAHGPSPDVQPIGALRTRMWLQQGNLNEAQHWVAENGLSVEDDLIYLREFEHITLARVLLAQGQQAEEADALEQALSFLERLAQSAEEGGRLGHVIEAYIVLAVAHQSQGNRTKALAALERALAFAAPEGYVRVFVDEGEPMRALLHQAVKSDSEREYVRQILAAFGDHKPVSAPSVSPPSAAALLSPLTARELEILHLIAAGQRNQEIADALFISLATVKRHIANTYGKLDVRHRTEAVARAQALGLI